MSAPTGQVEIRFYEELNDFLPAHRRKRPFTVQFHRGDTVKALVESLGVPHTEVDLVLADGRSVSFSHKLADGERVSVYPVFESLDVGALTRVRARALRRTRFVLDVHLGRLARLLRMLGFDSVYANDLEDGTLSHISAEQGRIILTRDRELLKRSIITHGHCVRSSRPTDQLAEVIRRFDLRQTLRPFTRCLECNAVLKPVSPERAARQVPPHVARTYQEFRSCPRCGRVYWKGSHWEHMSGFLDRVSL